MVNEVLRSVRELLPMIAEGAEKVDESRRVPDQVVRELGDAGMFKMLQPTRYGGM
ncbi:MAG: acyl-CoA dehydrogenase family protein, partial [Rhodococcus sp. (in: high G+C Gram-positive bacteria)]|uniref:acyl-CoA dehydrogenase family protein n=1 Tax=Rhodococcus sp. TaxID=1831 RepID=UPI003BB098ED